jgi:hypothetical protein
VLCPQKNKNKEKMLMSAKINIKNMYTPSGEVVAREIQGEFIIIPITSGAADSEDAIFTLNKTGKLIWDKLDGKKTCGP